MHHEPFIVWAAEMKAHQFVRRIPNIATRHLSLWSEIKSFLSIRTVNPNDQVIFPAEVAEGTADSKATFSQWKYFDDKNMGASSSCVIKDIRISDEMKPKEFNILRIEGKLERIRDENETFEILNVKTESGSHRISSALYKDKCFCAAKGILCKLADANVHEGLKLVLRTPTLLSFRMNIYFESSPESELYQMNFEIQPSQEWKQFHIPFEKFILVRRGKSKKFPFDLSSSVNSFE